MMDGFPEYGPVAIAVIFVLLALWVSHGVGKMRGYFQGRADVHREQRHAREVRR